ncbi:MAG: hypothetical protein LBQ88_09850 [Treponema sp.]|nr:hypothetical protein [Treponema sp.]
MYEILRIVVLVNLLTVFLSRMEEGNLFPYLVYTVPNALFPLMALFMWINIERYRPYISLYAAGKIIAVVSFLAWFILSLDTIKAFVPASRAELILLGGAFLLAAGDILSIAGECVLIFGLKRFDAENKRIADMRAGVIADSKEYPVSGQGGV